MKKVLFISGSLRNGNTEYILQKVFDKTIKDKEFVALRDLDIHPCHGCRACKKTATCKQKDDMTDLAKKLVESDIIVLGSPNYFANVSGIVKNFIDRTLIFFHQTGLKGKKIVLISTGFDIDSKNEKYIIQGTHGLVNYQKMELLGTYGFCTEDEKAFKQNPKTEEKINSIIDIINK